jgi:two-component system response regulator AtoC
MRQIILLGDDDGVIGSAAGPALSDEFQLVQVNDLDAVLSTSRIERPALVVVVLHSYDTAQAFAPVAAIKRFDADVPIAVVGPKDDIARSQALKLGATEFIATPVDAVELSSRIRASARSRRLRREIPSPPRERVYRLEHEMIFDASARMENVRRIIETVAHLDCTVLIRGESGTGKELVARALASPSLQQGKPFVKVNCAALPSELLESELFGYERGAFTGAVQRKLGKFEFAHQGTIFLDEIGEMSLRMQAMLLRFLENGEIQSVGAQGQPARVDVRVIAATNRNLPELIAAGQFREDLMYRLRVIHLEVPPLRDRREDIRLLAEYFARGTGRSITFTEAAMQLLVRHRWPGNVRELHNIVEQAVLMSDSPVVDVDQLPQAVRVTAPLLLPTRERRRQVADELYNALVTAGYSFWDHIYPLFLSRDITRHDMRELVRRGLATTRGNYRALLKLFGMPAGDYKRFLNFLAAHDCRADFREFRNGAPDVSQRPRLILPPLTPKEEGCESSYATVN